MEVKQQQELIRTLREKIALYEPLGIEVVTIGGGEVRLRVPLDKNYNHKGTAFGGSLYAAAVMGAYALVFAGLKERGIATENIVIAKGEIHYLRPVDSDFEVRCRFPDKATEEKFYQDLVTHKRVRGLITSHIIGGGESLKASFEGLFVVKY